jgi:hypothetical protein
MLSIKILLARFFVVVPYSVNKFANCYEKLLDLQHARSCLLQVQRVRVTFRNKKAVYTTLHYAVRSHLGNGTFYIYESYAFSCCIECLFLKKYFFLFFFHVLSCLLESLYSLFFRIFWTLKSLDNP